MKQHFLHMDLIKAVALPVVVACLALTIAFSFISRSTFKTNIDAQIRLAHQFVSINYMAKKSQNKHTLLAMATESLLAIPTFTNIHIIDINGDIVFKKGLPISIPSAALYKSAQNLSTYEIFEVDDQHFTSFNVAEETKVILGINNSLFAINKYQNLLILFFIFVVSMIILQIYLSSFNHSMMRAITSLEKGVSNLIGYNYNKKIDNIPIKAFQPLSKMLFRLSDIQRGMSEQALYDIEKSTQELRETLDTVERQNIELDIAKKSATKESRIKSRFLANTSHEVKTPLNGIMGFTRLLKKTSLDAQQKEYLDTIERSAQGLLTIMNDILDFSKLDIDTLNLEYKPLNLRELVNEVILQHINIAEEKKLKILNYIDHDIPEQLLGDPLRLKQILGNLISNAIKFSDNGNIFIYIKKDNTIKNHFSLRFTVIDQGGGLSDDLKQKIFNPFIQLDTSENRLNGGIGLGLAITKGLIQKMHGAIYVKSQPNKGSEFSFVIAIGRDLNINQSQSFLYDSLRNVHAMVHGGNEPTVNEITHYLDGWGVNSTKVENINQCIEIAQQTNKKDPVTLAIIDTYDNPLCDDKNQLIQSIINLESALDIPVFIISTKSIQRIIEPALINTNHVFINRPLFSTFLHKQICEKINIRPPHLDSINNNYIHDKTHSIKPPKVLIVDDNPANLKLVSELLKELNTESITVNSGQKSIEQFEKTTFDLIFMDIQMPIMDGFETTKKLRQLEKTRNKQHRIPIIALTAHAVSEQKKDLLLAGLDDALSKPVNESELKHTIEKWTGIKLNSSSYYDETVQIAVLKKAPKEAPKEAPKKTYAAEQNIVKASDKVIDISQGLALANNNADLATDMLTMLIESLEETSQRIATNDLATISAATHKLYGGCCYTGAPKLRQAAKCVDLAIKNNQLGDIDKKIKQLEAEILALSEWAKDHDIEALFS